MAEPNELNATIRQKLIDSGSAIEGTNGRWIWILSIESKLNSWWDEQK